MRSTTARTASRVGMRIDEGATPSGHTDEGRQPLQAQPDLHARQPPVMDRPSAPARGWVGRDQGDGQSGAAQREGAAA
jgi:hypothetical protein